MKALVPLLAMVPRFLTSSSLDIPTPVSLILSTFFSLSTEIRTSRSALPSMASGCVSDSSLILSRASEAFEMSSRKKMSLFEYKELMMMSSKRLTSA